MSERLNVYIAGPIAGTGLRETAVQRFADGCNEVAALGYIPISPIEVCQHMCHVDIGGTHTWTDFMKMDIRALLECDGIYLLRGWENSRGARLEKLIADGLDMFILYQSEGERDGKSDSGNRGAGTSAAG